MAAQSNIHKACPYEIAAQSWLDCQSHTSLCF